ncbi:MAG: hypothetical protein ACRBF0_20555 [Calditrichia bacterium]
MRALFSFSLSVVSLFFIASCSSGEAEKVSEVKGEALSPVIMVCEHGAVKSVMAMELFNKEAKKRGLNVRAESRGIDLYEAIPPKIATLLEADGFNAGAFKPQALSRTDVTMSSRVVAIGTNLSAFQSFTPNQIVQWNDIPPASVDFKVAQAAMLVQIRELLDELEKS